MNTPILDTLATSITLDTPNPHRFAPVPDLPVNDLEYLAEKGGYVELLQLIERVPLLPWPEHVASKIRSGLIRASRTGNYPERSRALRLLVSATERGHVNYPAWSQLADLVDGKDASFLAELSDLLVAGVLAAEYPEPEVRTLLERWVPLLSSTQPNRARLNLVRLLATMTGGETIPIALESAFATPIDGGTISALVAYLNRASGPGQEIPISDKIQLVIATGQRLAGSGITSRARRNVPGAWKDVLDKVMNHATDEQLCEVVQSIPSMAPEYAERLLSRFPIRSGHDLVANLQELLENRELSPAVQRQVTLLLEATPMSASSEWPELPRELAVLATSGGAPG